MSLGLSSPPVDPFEQEPGSLPWPTVGTLRRACTKEQNWTKVCWGDYAVQDKELLLYIYEVWAYLDKVRVIISDEGEYGLGRVVKERLKVLHERGMLKVNVNVGSDGGKFRNWPIDEPFSRILCLNHGRCR